MTLVGGKQKSYSNYIGTRDFELFGVFYMKNTFILTRKTQIMKKRHLEREISWVKKEFKDFTTLSDIELYNTERYASLHLGINLI